MMILLVRELTRNLPPLTEIELHGNRIRSGGRPLEDLRYFQTLLLFRVDKLREPQIVMGDVARLPSRPPVSWEYPGSL